MNIYIIGHLSPDLDAVSSTVTYAELLTKLNRYPEYTIIPVVAENINNETKFVFEHFKIDAPKSIEEFNIEKDDKFILVDHNEQSQRHELVNENQLIEIVDHHRINLSFVSMVRIDVKPYGSTNTIIYELSKMFNIKLSDKAKGLILSSILSDTVGLKSSTTTGFDHQVAIELSQELKIDIPKFTFEIFKSKSDITGLSTKQIATKDFKVFDYNGNRVFLNQIETVEPQKILDMKDQIISEIENIKIELNVSQAYVIVTDILNINSYAIYQTTAEQHIIEKAFTTKGQNNIANIGPKISRKKDIAPAIELALENII